LSGKAPDEQVGNRCIGHDDDKRNAVDTGNVGNLYYWQALILGVSDKKPWKTREQKGTDKFACRPDTGHNNDKGKFQSGRDKPGAERKGKKIGSTIETQQYPGNNGDMAKP
jgi:hypothetical protein